MTKLSIMFQFELAVAFFLLMSTASGQVVEHVGTIGGQYDVTKTGAGSYRIPIKVTPGTGGLRPNLSLSYNHRGGTGIAGQGWTITGLSRITRCGKTLAQDNEIRGVQFDSDDRFCLDGQRLILISGIYGSPGSEYRTEIDSFRKVVANGIQGAGPQSFSVWDRDGTKHSYGHEQFSSDIDTASNSYQFWARYRTEDTFQNAINYVYHESLVPGQFLLHRVEYTTNTGQGLFPRYDVVFGYGQRPDSDTRSGFSFGMLRSNQLRLKSITNNLVGTGGGEIRTYDLTYQTGTSGRSQLTAVTMCRANDCLPASEFDWQDSVPGWATAQSSGKSSSGHTNPLVGDFDGDGQEDLFVVYGGEWNVIRASGGSFAAPIDTNKSAPNASYTMPIDFDGDGKTDLLVPGNDAKWHVYLSTGTGFTDINTGEVTTGYTESFAQDVDGDGLGDLLYKSGTNIYLRKSTGNDLSTIATVVLSDYFMEEYLGSSRFQSGNKIDFDGDGRGDILMRTFEVEDDDEYGYTVYEQWDAYRFNGTTYSYHGYIDLVDADMVPLDLNGDGLTDLMSTTGFQWQYRYSTGRGFTAKVNSGLFLANYNGNHEKAVFADYDGDGRKDIISPSITTWQVSLSTDSGFASPSIFIGGTSPLTEQVIPMDVAGDGLDELVVSSSNVWKVRDHNSPLPDVVTRFTDGLDNYVEPTYQSISTSDHYSQTYFGNPPEDRSFQGPFFVVTDVTANDGIGGTYTNTHYYWGAKMHLKGRGFLGFRQKREYDYREGTRMFRNLYRQDFPYVGRLEWAQVRQADWTLIQQTDPNWGATQTYTGAYFVRPSSTTRINFEVGGILNGLEYRRVVDDPTYENTYGNVTTRIITTTSPLASGENYITNVSRQFDNLTSNWCLGLPTQITVT